jgi:hypothetical protein
MMMLVNMYHEGLVVHPTHRLVKDIENFDANKLISDCSEYFSALEINGIENAESALKEKYEENKCAFAFYSGGENFTLLTLKEKSIMDSVLPEMSSASRNLDVSVLHNLILERLLGMLLYFFLKVAIMYLRQSSLRSKSQYVLQYFGSETTRHYPIIEKWCNARHSLQTWKITHQKSAYIIAIGVIIML